MKISTMSLALAMLVVALAGSAPAATVSLVTVADADVRHIVPDYSLGNRTEHTVKYPWTANDGTKLYMKFELPADFMTATAATFKITSANVYNPLWFFEYYVHGLADDGGGGQEEWQERNTGTGSTWSWPYITWNNAPGNDVNSENGFLGNAPLLGTVTEIDDGVEISLSNQALVDFLNTDTDGLVTIMMSKVSQTSANSTFVSREGAGVTYPNANPPTLELTYVPIPEPATIALLVLGGLVGVRRRK